MTTIIKATAAGYTVGGLPQNYSINEGTLSQTIAPITITSLGNNYSDYFHAYFDIFGTPQSDSILLNCSALNGLSLTRTGDDYILTSNKVVNGVTINNWAYFKKALANLSLQFTNSDISQSFAIYVTIRAGSDPNPYLNPTIAAGPINIAVASVPDATGLNQTFNTTQVFGGYLTSNQLSGYGGANIQIADPNQAAKTYRVTYTVNDVTNGSGTSDLRMSLIDTPSSINYQGLKTFTVTGTQAYINGVFTNSGGEGFYVFSRSGEFYGTQSISYVQEVLTSTEIGAVVPYVQETGTLTFNIAQVAPFAITPSFPYTEDSNFGLSAGTLTDRAGQEWPAETSVNQFNYYTMTVTALGSFSGTNPIVVTYSGDAGVNHTVSFNGTFSYMTNGANPPSNLTVIPPADHTSDINLEVVIARGNGVGMSTIYTGNIIVPCTTTHADFTLNGSHTFAIGANSIDFGSITDLAVSKNYSSTLDFQTAIAATLGSSGSGGTSTWNASGGVGGFGRLTLTGTKTQVNSHLAAIDYTTTGGATLNDYVNIIYTQNQTTNVINQGTQNVLIANIINWGAGNGIHDAQNAFVYDQDVPMWWDLASLGGVFDGVTSYTAKLIFSTPLSTANLGSVTGWTKETDYIWTKTDVKANLNAALAAVLFVPPAQLISDFQLDIAVYNGVTPLYDTATLGSTKTVYLRTPVEIAWTGTALSYNQDTVTTFTNLATLNANFAAATTYTIELVTSVATGGSLTGWTTVNSTTFSKTDTATNLQTALNSVVFTPGLTFVSSFTFTLKSYRSSLLLNTSATKSVAIGVVYGFTNTGSTLSFNQDTTTTWAPFGTFSANFDAAKTYTIELVTSVASVGTFTGWTTVNTTTFSKTDTGANLITAMASLQFVPSITGQGGFTITTKINRSATLVATSAAKSISIGLIYSVAITGPFNYDEDRTQTYVNKISLNTLFNNSKTYTAIIRIAYWHGNETFTGWTKTPGDNSEFTKTDTGTNLITALNNLEFFSGFNDYSNNYFQFVIVRNAETIYQQSFINLILINKYDVYTSPRGYYYGTGGTFNYGTLIWFETSATYTATLVANTPYITLTGGLWTSVDAQTITVTGNSTTVQNALNSITVDPDNYYSGTFTISGTFTKSATTIVTSSLSVSCSTAPGLGIPSTHPFIIGDNYDYSSRISLIGIPNDGSTYSIRVETNSNQIFGNMNSSGVTWSSGGATSYVSSLGTKAQLEAAVADIKLFTRIDSTLQLPSAAPNIRYSLEAPAPFVTQSTVYVPMSNAARVNTSIYNLNMSKPASATFNLGTFWFAPGLYLLDASKTYTAKLDLVLTGVTITGWYAESSTVYSINGTPSELSTAIAAVQFNTIATAAPRIIFLKVYESSTYLSTQSYSLNI